MPRILRLRLCGWVCDECRQPLAGWTVRVYAASGEKVLAETAADPKHTFAVLDEQAVGERSSRLLGEARLDDAGGADLELGERYDGGPVQLDVAWAAEEGGRERQFALTTLQPAWREQGERAVAVWDHCIHARWWCRILEIIGLWVICGRVVLCEDRRPLPGVTVSAFDRDWLEDDPLGQAVTDANGHFRIVYPASAFRQGTVFDVELFGGPDVYFHVHAGGAPLLIEPKSRGRDADRENRGPCFCLELCVDEDPGRGTQSEPPPVFTHVGGIKYADQIESAPADSGLTVGSGRAFFQTLRLNGILPKTLGGQPMEYRFEIRELQANGTPMTAWQKVTQAMTDPIVIGQIAKFAPTGPGDPNPIKTTNHVAAFTGDWIQVPQQSNVFGPDGYFVPNGNMIRLDTRAMAPPFAPYQDVDLNGLVTGQSATSTGQPLAQNRHFAIRMRVRQVGNAASEQTAGVCQHIAINNVLYDNLLHHPTWMPVSQSNALGVAMVDIAQLQANGCAEIGDQLDVVFTAAHPTLGSVSVSMSGPGGPFGFTLPVAVVPGDRFGTATPSFTVSDLAPCAYIVTLSVQLLLTTGDSVPDNLIDQIAFTKA